MRSEMSPSSWTTDGSSRAGVGDLAMRLVAARHGLGRSIDNARANAAQQETIRVSKRRDQESAEKLQQAAAAAAEALAERQSLRIARPRGRYQSDGGDQ
jgi:hypothetical protein